MYAVSTALSIIYLTGRMVTFFVDGPGFSNELSELRLWSLPGVGTSVMVLWSFSFDVKVVKAVLMAGGEFMIGGCLC